MMQFKKFNNSYSELKGNTTLNIKLIDWIRMDLMIHEAARSSQFHLGILTTGI